MIAMEK